MSPKEASVRLAGCSAQIDVLDRQLVSLLNDRARIVESIGRIKRECSMRVYEPRREDEVLANVLEHNAGPLKEDALRRIYERLLDEMRTLQRDRMLEDQAPRRD